FILDPDEFYILVSRESVHVPPDFAAARLRAIHAHVALLSHLDFVPRIHATREGDTVIEADGRVWDLSTWVAGKPEHGVPSAARVEAAAVALAAVHAAWRPLAAPPGPAPAVLRRLKVLANWDSTRADRRREYPAGPFGDAVGRAVALLSPLVADAWEALQPWSMQQLPLQPCLVDVWPEHVHFDGNRVAGLIDFGAVQDDHVGADLARLFAGFPGPDALPAALAAYRAGGGILAEPDAFVRLLAHTGVVCGAAAWVVRAHTGLVPADPAAAAARLHHLLDRLP
ncbi:2'-deoxycytidine 5'-triphosphate deaminase, partial [bacterium]|nr:2'-deoxycytidine 5'-triphosphate deaminase [bacterium]